MLIKTRPLIASSAGLPGHGGFKSLPDHQHVRRNIWTRVRMTKFRLEYIWLDGYTPTPNLRGKTQLKDFDAFPTLEQLPLWGFDGSSTMQAEGHSSDCVLKPVAVYPDAARTNGVLVMCEVMMPDGKT